jgi:hypothetical protein
VLWEHEIVGSSPATPTTLTSVTNVRMIVCIDGDRIYVVEADYKPAEKNSPDIGRFLNSFTLP